MNVRIERDGPAGNWLASAAKLLVPIALFVGVNVWFGIAPGLTAALAIALTGLSVATLRSRMKWRSVVVTDRGLTLTGSAGQNVEASLQAITVLQVRPNAIVLVWMDRSSKQNAVLAKPSFSEESWGRLSQAMTALSDLRAGNGQREENV